MRGTRGRPRGLALARRVASLALGREVRGEVPADLRMLAEEIREALRDLRGSFGRKGEDWFRRAVIRYFTVQPDPHAPRTRYFLEGIPELGDAYRLYTVTLSPLTGKYTCSCHSHAHGRVREARVCTHAAAVMLFRRVRSRIVGHLEGGED